MLKQTANTKSPIQKFPAAFRRLCVETVEPDSAAVAKAPAAFRRLCVETQTSKRRLGGWFEPAAFRRLCVETNTQSRGRHRQAASRLQAAVC